jgi:hypothetical protein
MSTVGGSDLMSRRVKLRLMLAFSRHNKCPFGVRDSMRDQPQVHR